MTSSAPIAAIERIEKALEGVTPGPWDVWREPTPTKDHAKKELLDQVDQTVEFAGAVYLLNAGGKCPAETGCGPTSAANAAYIAACSPDVTPGILALARQAEEMKRENAEKDARIAALETALKPFAAHQTADGLDGPGSLLHIPDDHPLLFNGLGNDVRVTVTVGDVRRARSLTKGESDA